MMTMTLLNASSSAAVGCSIVAPSLHCTQVLLSPPPLLCGGRNAHGIPSPSGIFPCIASLRIGRSVLVSTKLSVGASWTSNRHRLRRTAREFAAGHLEGSGISRYKSVKKVSQEFDKDDDIVVSGACPEIKCGGGGSIGSKRKGRKGGRKDPRLDEKYPTLSFLEVQERMIKECNTQVLVDAENLLAQSNNKFGLVLEIAEEANEYLRHNKDESLTRKPILKVISDRINEGAGEQLSDAYIEDFVTYND
ncbi:unnamed protein product [Sphagnum troendelagicum]